MTALEKCYFCEEEDEAENLVDIDNDGTSVRAHEECATLQTEKEEDSEGEED